MAKKRSSMNSNNGGPEASFKNEVILWGVLALSVILFISNFGIAGKLGSAISSIFFGLFGFIAYIFPILLFAGTAFIIANQDNMVIMAKVVAFIVFLVFLCMFLELIGGNSLNKSPLDSYLWSVKHRFGGGLVGGVLTWLIRSNLGTISAYIIDIAAMIICIVLITERSLWKPIRSGGRKVYDSARNETIRQREEFAERRQRRMDNKVTGVSTDTTIKEQAKPAGSDAVSEIHPVPAQDFPIHMMGQEPESLENYDRKKEPEPAGNYDIQEEPGLSGNYGRKEEPTPQGHPQNSLDGTKTQQDDLPEYLDQVIPIANQKVVLQPNLPEKDTKEVVEDTDWEEDILANTSDVFSDLLLSAQNLENRDVPHHKQAAVTQDMDDLQKFPNMGEPDMGGLQGMTGPDMELRKEHDPQEVTDMESWQENVFAEATDMESWQEHAPQEVTRMEEPHLDVFADLHEHTDDADSDFNDAQEPDFGAPPASAEELIAQQLRSAAVQQGRKASAKPASADQSEAVQQGRKASAESASAGQAAVSAAWPVSKQAVPAVNPRQSQAEIASGVADVSVQMQTQSPPKQEYVLPPVHLLKHGDPKKTGDSRQHLQETALKLQQTLKNFGVNVTILNVSCGPSVTRYEIQPEMGVKVSKIVNLADDIKLNLAAADIRIEAPIPGKAAIGIEVPNKENVPVMFRDLVESEDFKNQKSPCAFAAGKDIAGQVVVTDICKMPHLLIAGATGSGKSVCINTIIMSIIYKADPNDVKLIMIDPKVVELSVYNGIPHLLLPVVTDPKKAAGALHWAVSEMMDRYQKFADYGVRDMKGYNAKIKKIENIADDTKPQKMPYIVIIVDELADLMMAAPGDVEDAICRLAQLARAAGIHLIIATQRPSVNVITGLIKANMPSRIAFSVTSGIDSRTILDMNGAEKLLGKGDMLFYPQGYQKPVRVQGAFVSDSEVSEVVEFLTEHNGTTEYNPAIAEKVANAASSAGASASDASPGDDRDVYFADAAKLLIEKDKASVSMLQRYFKIGFNRAARIMDQLEEAGIVGPEEGTKPRKILMGPEEFEQYVEEVL